MSLHALLASSEANLRCYFGTFLDVPVVNCDAAGERTTMPTPRLLSAVVVNVETGLIEHVCDEAEDSEEYAALKKVFCTQHGSNKEYFSGGVYRSAVMLGTGTELFGTQKEENKERNDDEDDDCDDFCYIVVPGFYDAHIHAISSGIKHLFGCSLLECKTFTGPGQGRERLGSFLRQRLSEAMEASIPNARCWAIGSGWRRDWFEDLHHHAMFPSSGLLDAIAADEVEAVRMQQRDGSSSVTSSSFVPPAVYFYLRDMAGHTVWLNTAAMQLFHETFKSDARYSTWEKDGFFSDGCLREAAADAVIALLPSLTAQDRLRAIDHMQHELIQCGVVGYQEAGLFPDDHAPYLEWQSLAHSGASSHTPRGSHGAGEVSRRYLPMSVRGLIRVPHDATPESRTAVVQRQRDLQIAAAQVPCDRPQLLHFDGFKVFVDGSIANFSAAMINYPQQQQQQQQLSTETAETPPEAHEVGLVARAREAGNMMWDLDELRSFLMEAAGLLQGAVEASNRPTAVHCHVIGDAASTLMVDVFAQHELVSRVFELQLAHVYFLPDEFGPRCVVEGKEEEEEGHINDEAASLVVTEEVKQLRAALHGSYGVFSPLWFTKPTEEMDDGEWTARHDAVYGPQRRLKTFPHYMFPPSRLAFGSDYPVDSFDVLSGIRNGIRCGVPPIHALYGGTLGAAAACGFGDLGGSFLPGKRADFVRLRVPKADAARFIVAYKRAQGTGPRDRTALMHCRHGAVSAALGSVLATATVDGVVLLGTVVCRW